jgi:cell division transport system permease protein
MSTRRQGRIMPRWEGAAPLDLVIAVMAFLASLALGASLVADVTAKSWRAGLAESITVQILPPVGPKPESRLEEETDAVLSILQNTKGIFHVQALSEQESRSLLAPWLGSTAMIRELPLPRLLDAKLQPGAAIDMVGLQHRLKTGAPDSLLDDHARWLGRLKRLADAVIWSAWGIMGLIALATAAAVTFATRASLAAHHEIVSLLHLMGARGGFIARAFEWHYFSSAVLAAFIGASLAGALLVTTGQLEQSGFEPVPFLPPIALAPLQLLWLLFVPLAAGMIALATTRLSVLAVLNRNY